MRSLASIIILFVASSVGAAEPDAKGLEFFEKKIRPVLLDQCSKCHSVEAETAKKLKGGLILDTRTAMLAGGDSGPAIVPGKPKESKLLDSLHYEGETKMPPKGKLDSAVIADFTKWIEMGAPAPESAGGSKKQVGLSIEEGRKFWAYQSVMRPVIPVRGAPRHLDPIDWLVGKQLDTKALKPAPLADKATLIRRVTYDLTGLPPTPEQVDTFVNDASADAYAKLVDRLLASQQYGERWGRHWLDIARYGESVNLRGFIYKDAWRYRDYVLNSFNSDLPFNTFIREQIAGDLLPATTPEEKQRQTVAATFLMLGNTNFEEQDKKLLRMDVVDEQLDVITKGFLGQTVTCARCHDHKFDPIPTKDYYALAGILRSTKSLEHSNVSKWMEVPLPTDAKTEAAVKANETAIKALQSKLAAAKKKGATTVAAGVLAIKDVPGVAVDSSKAKQVGEWKLSTVTGTYIGDGYLSDDNKGKGEKSLTFQADLPASGKYEVRLAYSAGPKRADNVPVHISSADGDAEVVVNMKDAPPIDGRFKSLGTFRFEKSGQSFVIVSTEGTKGHVTPDCVTFIAVEENEATQEAKAAKAEPDSTKAIDAEIKKLQASGPKRPTAMVPVEEKTIEDCKIHIRGSVSNLGETAPRGVLTVAVLGKMPEFPKGQSGRVELADWIASPNNPLTARVITNRTWHWLFGSGIVRTTDNFGTTGELPSNPELLDYLASRFVEDGWSMKKLVRQIVMSETYRRKCVTDANDPLVKADPENRLFGRANRKRMEAEELRDTMLSISGKLLSDRMTGPTYPGNVNADYNYKNSDTHRSVYQPVFRNSLPEIFEVFDFAEPSMVVGVRNVSTVAPQALYLMNHLFVHEQAKATATRLLAEPLTDDDARLTRLYRQALGRAPTDGERSVAKKFLAAGKPELGWAGVVQTLFASAEFRYLE
ncbi:DUF1549 domain-containing protein [soil metagenome]